VAAVKANRTAVIRKERRERSGIALVPACEQLLVERAALKLLSGCNGMAGCTRLQPAVPRARVERSRATRAVAR
jgi:hypothetical protein